MTTEEIMRMQAPKTLGEWAFQGFPGRRKREGRARELAAEGMQQRLAEKKAEQDIVQARVAEMLKLGQANSLEELRERARLNEEQARYENALRIQAGQILGREGVQNALAQAQGMVPIGENAAIGQEMLKYGAQDQMELIRRKQEENAMRQEAHQSGIDLQASQAFENRGRGAAAMFPRPAEAQRPFAVPQGSVVFDAQGRPSYAVGLDANSNPMANPLFAPDAPPEARMPPPGGASAAPAQKPGLFQRMFGGGAPAASDAPRKTLVPGATGKTTQVQTGPNVGKDEAFQTNSLVAPTQQEALAEQPTVFANSYLPRFYRSIASQPGNMGGVQFVNPRSEEQIATDLYTANRQSMMPDAAYMRGTYTPGRSRRLDASLARPSRAFQYLQSLYQ